jgi:hypothetical protein
MDERYGIRTSNYNLRPRKDRNYDHLFVNDAMPLNTPQMSMKQGIALFGEDGIIAVKKELFQLYERKVMIPEMGSTLSIQDKRKALGYLMFLKRKRCGKIKARGCADGRKQRLYITKEDAASPTVSNESVFITAVIDAMEDREVAVADLPGAFMQADMDTLVHVRFVGKMVELLLEIDRSLYEPYITCEKGEKVLYVRLLKALYGTIRAARLFYDKLTCKLQEWGFDFNQYDRCVANKIVNGNQLTVIWHVDDLKVSHKEVKVVDEFMQKLDDEFGKETPINKSNGQIHNYLGMVLDYTKHGCVRINMTEYIKMLLYDMPNEMIGTAATPASSHLFVVNEDSEKMDKIGQETYVHYVMQLLYLSQQVRPDIRTAVSFLYSLF